MTLVAPPPLWEHQRDAVDFALERTASLWHMGLGTGKSRCAIQLAREVNARSTLILCPLSVCSAWSEQYGRFGDDSEVIVLNKGSVSRKKMWATFATEKARAWDRPLVVICNYESARNEPLASWLVGCAFDLLVLDESHRIKSHKGITSRWVARLARTCTRRVALTGTPLPHSPMDIWAQARALTLGSHEAFGPSFFKFRRKYARMGGFGGKQIVGFQALDDLRERMGKFTFQVDRAVLNLPPAMHERRFVDLSPKATKLYRELDTMFCAQVRGGEITASNALVKLLRLQQLTGGMASVSDPEGEVTLRRVDSAKEDALADLLDGLSPEEPVVCFARFRGDLETVHRVAKRLGRGSLELSGARRELEQWQGATAPVLAVQLQAGSVGIDLTRAAYVVFLSTGFSLGDYEQALGRNHRPGQKRTVFYYHIIAQDTVDEKVYAALRARKNIVEAVLDGIHQKAS
tara:strand:- start:3228 stop:4613 length:1386 start_codon:yes stop_codon:yes gene_type:complete